MMFKALLLHGWRNLSDPALKKALARDLLFRRCSGALSEFALTKVFLITVRYGAFAIGLKRRDY
jgi:hypothetical protein